VKLSLRWRKLVSVQLAVQKAAARAVCVTVILAMVVLNHLPMQVTAAEGISSAFPERFANSVDEMRHLSQCAEGKGGYRIETFEAHHAARQKQGAVHRSHEPEQSRFIKL